MVYRIHFSGQDLARTRVADAPLPMCELRLAMRALRSRSLPLRLDPWRRRVRERLSAAALAAFSQIPPDLWSPNFGAIPPMGTPEELLERVRATPRTTLRAELASLAERHPIPSWMRGVADDPELFRQLNDGLSGLYAALLGPYWSQVTDLHLADRTVRARQLLGGGVERLLVQANPPWMRWVPPTLEIRTPDAADHDLVLEGRGILLAPSAFETRSHVEAQAWPQPIVTYPANPDRPLRRLTAFTPEASGPPAALSALLGHTRSAVLTVIAEHPGCSTKELAAFAGIAPPSASEHATVLRQAGLIHTVRHRNAALHSPTSLGMSLLNTSGDRA